jgi:hypothetical protein
LYTSCSDSFANWQHTGTHIDPEYIVCIASICTGFFFGPFLFYSFIVFTFFLFLFVSCFIFFYSYLEANVTSPQLHIPSKAPPAPPHTTQGGGPDGQTPRILYTKM